MSDVHDLKTARVAAGVVAIRLDLAIATVGAGKAVQPALNSAMTRAFSVELPDGPRVAKGGDIRFVGIGPGRWLALAPGFKGEDLAVTLADAAGTKAAVCDQSDGYVVFDLSGERIKDTLAKMLLIDVESIGPGQAATTSASLIGVTIWRLDDNPVYGVAVGRSFVDAFLHALGQSAAEFGFSSLAA